MTTSSNLEEEVASLQETVAALEIRVEELQSRRTEGFYAFESMAHLEAIVAERTKALDEAKRNVERVVEERTRELRFKADELAKANQLLRELDQLKTNILQNVSHELKTPLVSIQGFTELFRKRHAANLSPQQIEFLDIILRNAIKLNEEIESLLEAGKPARTVSPIDMTRFDLCQDVRELLVSLEPQVAHLVVTVTSDLHEGGVPIVAHRHSIGQMLTNLISNALKFMADRPTRDLLVSVQPNKQDVVVEVRDTGIGIPADKLSRIFERFFQVDTSATRRYGGMGIGLSLVREVVEGHDGTIFVESETGVGTRFLVRLPLRPSAAAPSPTVPRIPSVPPDVVIIDDEEDSGDFFAAAVRQIGHVPTLCLDPTNAVKVVRPGITRLVLLDLAMPQMTGIQVLEELRNTFGDEQMPPVLLMTARSPGEVDERVFPPFVRDVIYRPCSIDDIRTAVENALRPD